LIIVLVTTLPASEDSRYWIYLKDKYTDPSNSLPDYGEVPINDRALNRRQLRGQGEIFDFTDLPLSERYITQLEKMGVEIYRKSRWLNAVSSYFNNVSVEEVKCLPFVLKVEPVKTFIYRPVEASEQLILNKPTSEEYGSSFNQNDMIGVPFAHEMGFHGEDILIAVFDTGFILDHEALQHIEVNAAWDFIYNDDNVANEEEDVTGQHNHGTQILSTLAGYAPGHLIGPAYASEFLLAKTDHLTLENQQDEDNWVAAAEWAESLGADIISSSVGYILDYSYEDMDGNTAAVTKAADMAVKKGVSVFVSAGNEGNSYWEFIIAPADGDSVISMGAVTPEGNYWAVSSRGPTFDGRIKPELMAQGQNVICVDPRSTNRYTTANGTSLSCPLGAGSGAIVLSVMPTMTPMELREILVKHASQSINPDNLMGYGLIDLEKVIFDMVGDPVVSVNSFEAIPRDGNNLIRWTVDLEVANQKWLISRKTPTTPYIEIGEIAGREFGISQETYSFYDYKVEGGEYFTYKLATQFLSGTVSEIDTSLVQSTESKSVTLSANFPNPFNSETKIIFSLNSPQKVSLNIYDINGKLVKTLIDNQVLDAQYHHILWDGMNDLNHSVSSGTYFLRLLADGTQKMMKMLYLK
jgi:hypothetical protein